MDYSVREAKAQFSAALSAAERGERVTVTRHGKPIAQIVPIPASPTRDAAQLDAARAALGLEDNADWFDDFISNPQASARALGLDD